MSGLYRVIGIQMWGDAKFRSLSDGAKLLWIYLLTGPETLPIPGVVVAGRNGLAEALGWLPKPFGERFGELFAKGMAKADWNARLVFLPRGIEHRSPDNPNVVKGWLKHFDLVPECTLKTEAIRTIYAHLETRGERYAKPFRERFGERLREPYGEQEQEQEKEKEKDQDLDHSAGQACPAPPDEQQPLELVPPEADPDRLTPERLVALWNEATGGRIAEIKPDRRTALRKAIARQPDVEFWRRCIGKAAAIRALEGNAWLTLDWLLAKSSRGLGWNAERVESGAFDFKLTQQAQAAVRDIRTGYVHHGASEEARFAQERTGDVTDEF